MEEVEFSVRPVEYEVPTGVIRVNVSKKIKI